jgi:hypothetical protein
MRIDNVDFFRFSNMRVYWHLLPAAYVILMCCVTQSLSVKKSVDAAFTSINKSFKCKQYVVYVMSAIYNAWKAQVECLLLLKYKTKEERKEKKGLVSLVSLYT